MTVKSPGISTHRIHTLVRPAAREDGLSGNVPTSQPATPQASYTVLSTDIPVVTPPFPQSTNVACIYIVARNNSGSARTFNIKVDKNGTEVYSGTRSVNTNNYATGQVYVINVQVGDVIDYYIWESSGTTTLHCMGFAVCLSRIALGINQTARNIVLSDFTHIPNFTYGSNSSYYKKWYTMRRYVDLGYAEYVSGDLTFPSWYMPAGDSFYKMYYGDSIMGNSVQWSLRSTLYPYGSVTAIPRRIEYDIYEERGE